MEAGKTTQGTENGKGEREEGEKEKSIEWRGKNSEKKELEEEKGTGCGMRWKWWIVMVWISGKEEKNQKVQSCSKIMERNLTPEKSPFDVCSSTDFPV